MEPKDSVSGWIATNTNVKEFEKLIQQTIAKSNYNGKIYVNLNQGTLSTNKTSDSVKVPLKILKETYYLLKIKEGAERGEIVTSPIWNSISKFSTKKSKFDEFFKSTSKLQKIEKRKQEKLKSNIDKQFASFQNEKILNSPIHMIGSVKHSPYQQLGEAGKKLDYESYVNEMFTISNKILVTKENGEIELDAENNPKYIIIPGIPPELHVYSDVLNDTFDEWEKQCKENKNMPRFDVYVQKKLHSKTDMKFNAKVLDNNVVYFTDEELLTTQVQIDRDGILHQIGIKSRDDELKPITDNSGNYMFVLGKDNFNVESKQLLFAAIKERTTSGKLNHSSFFRGGKVESAGFFKIKNGKIVSVEASSGHYKPKDPETAAILKYLQSQLPEKDFLKIFIIEERDGITSQLYAHLWLLRYEQQGPQ